MRKHFSFILFHYKIVVRKGLFAGNWGTIVTRQYTKTEAQNTDFCTQPLYRKTNKLFFRGGEKTKRKRVKKKKKSQNFAVCYNTRDMHDKLLHGYYTLIKYRWFCFFSLPLMYTINRSCHSQWQQLGARTITQMLRECCAYTLFQKKAIFVLSSLNFKTFMSRNLRASNNLHVLFSSNF